MVARDYGDYRRDLLIRVRVGMTTLAHVLAGQNMTILLEGRVDGPDRNLYASASVIGPADVGHGPFTYSVDSTLFGSFGGDRVHLDRSTT